MSEWRNIIKAPMPLNVRDDRDAEHKKRIIQFEKDKIEPFFTNYAMNSKSAENERLYVSFNSGQQRHPSTFVITNEQKKMLGGNEEFILKVIGEIYKNEGYSVSMNQSKTELKISQDR